MAIQKLVKPHWLLILVILLAFGLRVYQLERQSLRGDEAITYVFSLESVPGILELMRTGDPHPPGYYVATHYWMPFAGHTVYALRFLPVIGALMLVAASYTFGKILFNAWAGLIFAFLMAFNPYQIFYAQDARSYTFVTLLGVLSTIALILALRQRQSRMWFLYGLLVVTAMYTHYYFPFIVIFQGIYVIWYSFRRKTGVPRAYIVTGLLAMVAYLPWFVQSLGVITGYAGTGETVGFIAGIIRPLVAFTGAEFVQPERYWLIALLTFGLMLLGLFSFLSYSKEGTVLLVLYLFVPLLGVFLASLFRPIFRERYLIMASPAYMYWVGLGLLWLMRSKKIWQQSAGLALLIAFMWTGIMALENYYDNPLFAKSPPWREALNYINDKAEPGDALVYTSPSQSINYYHADRLPAYHIPLDETVTMEAAISDLEAALKTHDRLWLLPSEAAYPVAYQVEPWLNKHTIRLDETYFRILHVNLYESPQHFLQTMVSQPAKLADNIHLDGFRVGDERLESYQFEPGEDLDLSLVWHSTEPVETPYTVFTQLLGPDGLLYGQWDNQPGRGTYPTTDWPANETIFDQYRIPIQENAPPGNYQLLVGMYNPVDGLRLPVLNENGDIIADHIVLAVKIVIN